MVSISRVAALAAVAALVACGPGELGAPAEDEPGPDAGAPDAELVPQTRLMVEWRADPAIPAEIGGDFDPAVEAVTVALSYVRAIGDTGVTPGATVTLEWDDQRVPAPLAIDGVTPGLYSRLRGVVIRYRIVGTVFVQGERVPFEIADDPPPSVSLDTELYDCTVEAGATKAVEVEFETDAVIRAVDWKTIVPDDDGVLRIAGDDPLLGEIRKRLVESFESELDDD